MKTDRTQKGQALILIVLAVVGLLALTGLAVDGSATYSNRQGAQNAAETAALTGALDLANSKTSSVTTDAIGAAASSGFNNDTTTNTVTVNPGSSGFTAGCNGTTPSFSNNAQYVQVIIKTNVNTSFSSIVGMKQTHNCVDAIARGQSGTSGSMFNGAAIVATGAGSGCTDINLNSNASIKAVHGGIFDNCGASNALVVNSNASLSITSPSSNVQVVGGDNINGNGTVAPGVTTGAVGITMPAAAWAAIPAIPAVPTCSGSPGTVTPSSDLSGSSVTVLSNSSATISAGTYSALLLNGNATLNMNPGNYCLTGSLGLNGGNDIVNGAAGTINLSIGDNSLDFGSNTTNTFGDLEIWAHNGSFTVNNNAVLKATSKFRFYSTGSSTFLIDSNSGISAPDAFIDLTSGPLTMNANSSISLTAPTTGSYAGLAIYMPWSTNTSQVTIDANSGLNVTGTILAPNCPIEINSNGTANINSQVIGSTVRVEANSTLNVTFNAGQNYTTPTTAYVELIK